MNFLVITAAFFFAIMMCLELILVKWIIAQLGIAPFVLVLFLVVSIFLLNLGDEKYDDR